MCKPLEIYAPQTRNAKNPLLNALKYKVKQSKNGKFPSSCKASPIDFETQISHRR